MYFVNVRALAAHLGKPVLSAATGLFILLAASSAHADTIASNMGSAPGGGALGIFGSRYIAAPFTTGSDSFTLSSFTARLYNDNPGDVATVAAVLRSDNGSNAPTGGEAGVLVTFDSHTLGAIDPATPQDIVFTPSSGFALQSGTKYWLAINVVSGQAANWNAMSSGVVVTGSGTTPSDFSVSESSGTSWSTTSGGTLRFGVEGISANAAAPEPGTFALLGTGLGIVGLVARRRMK